MLACWLDFQVPQTA